MCATMLYQERVVHVTTKEDNLSISYIKCSPPQRLHPKGTILLLHGFLQTNYQFRNVIDLFAFAGYHVIAPNLVPYHRRHGARRRSWQTKSGLSHMLAGLLDKLQVTGSVHLVGHDMSATTVLNFAFRYPHRAASVTWGNASPLSTEISREARIALELLAGVVDRSESVPVSEKDLRSILKAYFGHSSVQVSAVSENDIDEYTEELCKNNNLDTMLSLYHASRHNSQMLLNMMETRGPSRIPSLLLNSSNNSVTIPAKVSQKRLFSSDSGSQTITIEDTGHFPAEEQPESYALRIIAFINGLPKQQADAEDESYGGSIDSGSL